MATTLSASATSVAKEVQEQKIYNVVYQLEDGRILNETPFTVNFTTLTNDSDEEASAEASFTYTDERSYIFNRIVTSPTGITASIEAGLPFIENGSITVVYKINGPFQWEETKTITKSVTVTETVSVPAKSTVTVEYAGTRGTCIVPFSYTRKDISSDGQIIVTDLDDGTYTGDNNYGFNFVVRDTQPL